MEQINLRRVAEQLITIDSHMWEVDAEFGATLMLMGAWWAIIERTDKDSIQYIDSI